MRLSMKTVGTNCLAKFKLRHYPAPRLWQRITENVIGSLIAAWIVILVSWALANYTSILSICLSILTRYMSMLTSYI